MRSGGTVAHLSGGRIVRARPPKRIKSYCLLRATELFWVACSVRHDHESQVRSRAFIQLTCTLRRWSSFSGSTTRSATYTVISRLIFFFLGNSVVILGLRYRRALHDYHSSNDSSNISNAIYIYSRQRWFGVAPARHGEWTWWAEARRR